MAGNDAGARKAAGRKKRTDDVTKEAAELTGQVAGDLIPQKRRFVERYLIHLNASRAAREAGYSEESSGQIGHMLIQDPVVSAAIVRAQEERSRRTQVTQDMVVTELARIAFYNPGRVFYPDENGLPKIDFTDATEEDWRVVAEIANETTRRETEDGTTESVTKAKVKHQCKLQALNSLMRHLGMNNDKVQLDVGSLTDEERAARAMALLDAARARRDGSAAGGE